MPARHSRDGDQPRRGVRRLLVVFTGSWVLGSVALMMLGFAMAMAACASAISGSLSGLSFGSPSGLGNPFEKPGVVAIRVPPAACPYLRLVSVAATDANAPWRDAFTPGVAWAPFAKELSIPLASLDGALGAAAGHVPGPINDDLARVRGHVEIGRIELAREHSVSDYLTKSGVLDGYATLVHAGQLVGNACGFEFTPPMPI